MAIAASILPAIPHAILNAKAVSAADQYLDDTAPEVPNLRGMFGGASSAGVP
jgi:hypothetical protein